MAKFKKVSVVGEDGLVADLPPVPNEVKQECSRCGEPLKGNKKCPVCGAPIEWQS